MLRWQELPFPRLAVESDRPRVALLPVGAIEAHGPHLPVGTDVWIAEAMARAAVPGLLDGGFQPLLLPALAYTPAPFAEEFPGTLSIRPETLTALVVDLARALGRQGTACLALANAHFDPAHLGALAAARDELAGGAAPRLAWPDLTRRALAARLTEEFQSGACHAGRYETSILLAVRPELVDEEARGALAANPRSLPEAIRAGHRTFQQAGGPAAYFGDPARGSREEGEETIARLGGILVDAVRAAIGDPAR